MAGAIKQSLEDQFGVEVFLAHDDIEPSSVWQDVIMTELKSCNVFLPILTSNFNRSNWTDQETGFALARDIPIIPINAGETPRGFIAKYQALRIDVTEVPNSCLEIAKVIASKPNVHEAFLNSVVKTFGDSENFARAIKMSGMLLGFKSYTVHQKNEIIRLAASNDQIYRSNAATRNLKKFIDLYKDDLDASLVEIYENNVKNAH